MYIYIYIKLYNHILYLCITVCLQCLCIRASPNISVYAGPEIQLRKVNVQVSSLPSKNRPPRKRNLAHMGMGQNLRLMGPQMFVYV